MKRAVIVNALRTPIGRRNGSLSTIHPVDLTAQMLNGLVKEAGIDPALVDDVIWGCVSQINEQASDIARSAVIAAGWPLTVPGVTIDRQCGSSQQAVHFAAAGLVAGHYDVAVAGGTEIMSLVEMGSTSGTADCFGPTFVDRVGGYPSQGEGAELIARKWNLTRREMDELGFESHRRAAASQDAGEFDAEILPITLPDGRVFEKDEGIRRGGSVEDMGKIRPAFREDGLIAAGNASQISDGSSALLMMTEEKAAELGMTPIAAVHTVALGGDDPKLMLTAPIPATRNVFRRSGLGLADIGTFEFNEAFASATLAWMQDIGADHAKVNPQGGAIALGHPLGASGTRLMTTLVHRMKREGIRYGLQTMCEGGGMSNATILELM
ncbi:thiolase family protein [Novosphingopyxis sp.]|uniref:thiolase family protein n=1 Tax=Novosphingopyxis sp. TaxID=2709690 RepID=UPI003B5AE1B1